MTRKEELLKVFNGVDESIKSIVRPMIDEVVFLEHKLDELRKLPTIAVNKKNPTQQRLTISGKQYKEYLQQYSNCVKILCSVLNRSDIDELSPLQQYIKSLEDKYQ